MNKKIVMTGNKKDSEKSFYDLKTVTNENGLYTFKLGYSNFDGWQKSYKGKNAAYFEMNGNGMIFASDSGTKVRLNYLEVEQLKIVLDEYYNNDPAKYYLKYFKEAK